MAVIPSSSPSSSLPPSSVVSLQYTPTWAVAIVCFCIIAISIALEQFIHLFCSWLKRNRKKALIEAVEKLKSELMVMGFISLLLAVLQRPISKICIPSKLERKMLPCRRRPISAVYYDHCVSKGMVSLISEDGLHQLHIFIFVLAVMHVVYSTITMGLGRAKILLLLGAKLEVIVTRMALQLKEQGIVIRGAPLVQPNDELFWVSVQVLCSYITLPLYALVTQMGSQYKSAVLEEEVTKILKKWHERVKEKRKHEKNIQEQSNSFHSIFNHSREEGSASRANSPKASSSTTIYVPSPSSSIEKSGTHNNIEGGTSNV
ncbi:hypothetical protein Sjap_013911 [Stephania japonica]|uniref:MLO-like protein n=1 Tax=Stephania japonica TaxID=461633 RepID=A0AAP0IYS0_9MAGN